MVVLEAGKEVEEVEMAKVAGETVKVEAAVERLREGSLRHTCRWWSRGSSHHSSNRPTSR